MCGIVGYIGKRESLPILIDGLKKLEYRGYDSAGIAVLEKGNIRSFREVGKVSKLEDKIAGLKSISTVGIAHTRWATHGKPSVKNSHPHCDCKKEVFVVHNGIVENYQELKTLLKKRGHVFSSDTDTEVIAHLLEEELKKNKINKAISNALGKIEGTYGLAILYKNEPEKIYIAKKGSPLILGVGKDEYIVASDASAIVHSTKNVIYLEDGEMAEITPEGYQISHLRKGMIEKKISRLEWGAEKVKKDGYKHFMLKEIFEQPESIADAVRGRVNLFIDEKAKPILGGLQSVEKELREIEKLIIISCGTSYYAGLIGEYMIEEYAGIPVEVEYASEFRYRKPIIDKRTAVLAISQSGETADTLEAIREAKHKGALTLGIVNVVGSTIARETDAGVYNHAGPEVGVASTKAFTSQLAILALLALSLGRQREMSYVMGRRIAQELKRIPQKIEKILKQQKDIEKIAKKYARYRDWLYLGRKYNFPIALEGALKIKEIAYVHAEGYPAGEMKHGPIALIDKDFPSFVIAPTDSVYEKVVSGIEELRARSGNVVVVATEGNKKIASLANEVIFIPKTLEMLSPLLAVIPMQLFAYYVATIKGFDVDKPRNLAKSVTVE